MEAVVAKSHKVLKRKITRYIEEAMGKMLLQRWTIRLEWDLENVTSQEGMARLLQFQGMSEYMVGVIKVNLEHLSQCSDSTVRLNCFHEVAHALVLDYARLANSRCVTSEQLVRGEETLVQTLAKILAR